MSHINTSYSGQAKRLFAKSIFRCKAHFLLFFLSLPLFPFVLLLQAFLIWDELHGGFDFSWQAILCVGIYYLLAIPCFIFTILLVVSLANLTKLVDKHDCGVTQEFEDDLYELSKFAWVYLFSHLLILFAPIACGLFFFEKYNKFMKRWGKEVKELGAS